HCGFCQDMLDDLKQWERKRPTDAPELLIISTGPAEENRQLGLRAPILLDTGCAAMEALGGEGTPTAVLLDPRGNIVSGTASGAQDVLEQVAGRRGPVPTTYDYIQPGPAAIAATPTSNGAAPPPFAVQLPQGGPSAPAMNLPDLNGQQV